MSKGALAELTRLGVKRKCPTDGVSTPKPKPRWELHWAVMAKARQV